MLRRFLILGGVVAIFSILAVAALPWWWGAALRSVARGQGVEFREYSRVGYGRWALEDVVVLQPEWELRIDRVEAPHPLAWWWQRRDAGEVVVSDWRVRIDTAQTGDDGPSLSREMVFTQIRRAVPWIPPARSGRGEVSWGENLAIAAEGFVWQAGTLEATGIAFREHQANATLTWASYEAATAGETAGAESEDSDWTLTADDAAGVWSLRGVAATELERFELAGTWHGQPARLIGRFGDGNWVPDEVRLEAGDWQLTGDQVGVGAAYDAVRLSLLATWSGGSYEFSGTVAGEPRADTSSPALSARVRGNGDLTRLRFEQFDVSMPGLSAQLDEPATFARDDMVAGGRSRFVLRADLAQLPGSNGAGQVEGEVTVTTQREDWPVVEGELRLDRVTVSRWSEISGRVAGSLAWPRLDLTTVEFALGEDARASAHAAGDLVAKIWDEVVWDADLPAALLRDWLPAKVDFGTLHTQGELAGPWATPRHSGEWQANELVVDSLLPMETRGRWSGEGLTADVTAQVATATGRVDLAGSLRAGEVEITALSLLHGDAPVVSLARSAAVQWDPAWRIDGVELVGNDITLRGSLASLTDYDLQLQTRQPDTAWLADWWTGQVPLERLLKATLELHREGDTLSFAADLDGEVSVPQVGNVHAVARLSSDGTSTQFDEFVVGQGPREFARLSGHLPVYLQPTASLVAVDPAGVIDLNVSISPNPGFWTAVGEATGVTVSRPDISLRVTGTWNAPRADGEIAIGRLQLANSIGGVDWPALTEVRASLAGDEAGLTVDELSARIDGQTVRMRGRLPATPEDWARLRDEPWNYLREQGSAEIELPQADLAAFARLLPDYLVPTGTITLGLTFAPGSQVDGRLVLNGGVSRPLGPLGVLQDIEARLAFAGRRVTIERVQANMGGQPITLSGGGEWPANGPVAFDINLSGTNLPLVRRTGLLLRGDIDLHVSNEPNSGGAVEGRVLLRDGLMLADVRSLIPTTGGERRSGRPPYFSVEVDPFSEWRLEVAVEGDQFMRLRTPLVTGVASIDVLLEGTLGTPRALGEVTLDSGAVRLPFAQFNVEEAEVRLTAADPYRPEIRLLGEGKRFGYDLHMELTGTADAPQLQLSSDPSLPAADVLLLAMAGVAPQDEINYSTGERAMQLGVFLGSGVLRDLWGTDRTERFSVSSGEKLSRQGKETYRFNYELSERWTLVGDYDEFDYYNAGLKWRFLPMPEEENDAED